MGRSTILIPRMTAVLRVSSAARDVWCRGDSRWKADGRGETEDRRGKEQIAPADMDPRVSTICETTDRRRTTQRYRRRRVISLARRPRWRFPVERTPLLRLAERDHVITWQQWQEMWHRPLQRVVRKYLKFSGHPFLVAEMRFYAFVGMVTWRPGDVAYNETGDTYRPRNIRSEFKIILSKFFCTSQNNSQKQQDSNTVKSKTMHLLFSNFRNY